MNVTPPPLSHCPQCGAVTAPHEPCPHCAELPMAQLVAPRRSPLEVLLDPRSINWLLTSGGGLIMLGLIIWLTSLGVFDNPGVVGTALGLGNAAVIGGGWALIRRSRYQLAGRALTLLACLVLPLNLWFYHAHDLITLQGHLWVAALVCCAVYAASALVLRDPLFVYVLAAGVTLTGLLLLGDLGHLEEVIAPTTLLVVLALACLHAERAFPEGDGPFTRRRFGLAFFWSGQALLAGGLLLLLGAQVVGWLQPFGLTSVVAERAYLPWTLLLVLGGSYAYVYSAVVVRRNAAYIYLAALPLLWAEVQLLVLLNLAATPAAVLIVLALTALAANALQAYLESRFEYLRALPPLGLVLSFIPVIFGVGLYLRDSGGLFQEGMSIDVTWAYVAAMALTAAVSRAGAYLQRRAPRLVGIYFGLAAAATLVTVSSLAGLLGMTLWAAQAPLLLMIPIAYLVASHFYRDETAQRSLAWVAHTCTVLLLVGSARAALVLTPEAIVPVAGSAVNLLLLAFCVAAAVFYVLAAVLQQARGAIYFATALVGAALWQLFLFGHFAEEYYTLACAGLGLVLLIGCRLVPENLRRPTWGAGNGLALLGGTGAALVALSRLALTQADLARLDAAGDWRHPVRFMALLLLALEALTLLSAWLVQHPAWRRGYLCLATVNGVLLGLLLHRASLLSPWQRLEIASCAAGVALLIAGHLGWYRERRGQASDLVGPSFALGSLALVLPLLIASIVHRFGPALSPVDELLLVFGSVALLGSGILCKVRATTLVGAGGLALYVLMVLIDMHRLLRQQLIVGIYLTLGGALLFGTGLALSIYRDRLLALPDRVKRHEGIFRVLSWR